MSEEMKDLTPSDLMEMFPEAKLTMRDRLPTNMLLLYTILNINKVIKEIKYSTAEITESVLSLVAMIPDELRDEQFIQELKRSIQMIVIDLRPQFCGVRASLEYCKRKGIQPFLEVPQLNPLEMYHACFNLLMRKHMFLKIQPKEIMTGQPALEPEEIPTEEDEKEG